MKTIEQELLSEISKYRKATGLSMSKFGMLATEDPKLLSRLKKGKGITSTTINKIRKFLSKNNEA
jgi:tRNA U34 5-carboxymethylaminomethyl modifying enzyme MnmG/GidA